MAKRLGSLLVLLALTAGAAGPAAAGVVDHTIRLRPQDLSIVRADGYDVVTLEGADVTREPGHPQLPVLPVVLAIPAGAEVESIEILSTESSEIREGAYPRPAQPPRILPVPGLSLPEWRPVRPDPAVYGRARTYPGELAEIVSEGRLAGGTAVGIAVYPVQFLPGVRKLRFFPQITLRLRYREGPALPSTEVSPEPLRMAATLVENAEAVAPRRLLIDEAETLLDPGDYEYVIITDPGYMATLQPLLDWKTKKGVPTTMVSAGWIDATYPGVDTQERIREFIRDARDTWGAIWFLLGSDTQDIPARRAYAMTCEAGGHPDEDAIGCDLYYADLDGTWNADGDEIYGETVDAVDLYPDVFVGRASVRTNAQLAAFVSKVIAYEHTPPAGEQLDMLMAAEILWTDPFTDSGVSLNLIDRQYVPPRFDPITKLYETLGNESVETVVNALNDGKGLFLHAGHAWYTVMGCGEGYLTWDDVNGLTNAPACPVVYSIGCWPAAFDLTGQECIAEWFVRNPDGGAVAFIGNSRYGWGSPGNPAYGYSDRFMHEFYRVLFVEGIRNAGACLATAKAAFIPLSQAENVYRWHQYEINLLGDPEMPIWTDEPAALTVTHPDTVVAGSSVVDVAVWTTQGPVEDALVCLTNGTDLYERGRTGSEGTLALAVETGAADSIDVTVTAPDCHPYEARMAVNMAGAYLRATGIALDDAGGGNGDGLAGPGETVDVALTVRNLGTAEAPSVEASISTDDPEVTIVSADCAYGDIGAGSDAVGSPALTVSIDADCEDGHVVLFDVVISSGGIRTTWTGAVAMTVAAPVLSAGSYSIDDTSGGNGDGVADPGEALRIMVAIENGGLAPALSAAATLSSDAPEITVTQGDAWLADVAAGDTAHAVFGIAVSPDCPIPFFAPLVLGTTTSDGFADEDTLVVTVGAVGFAHDFEDGESGWVHGGAGDLWGLTDNRSHSGSTSWYCGSQTTWEYEDNMECFLDSPEFVVGPGSELSFWCWYEFPIYREDGFYVEILEAGVPVDTLDFIGSGGALGELGSIGNDWLEYRYPIGGQVGDTVQARFHVTSDDSNVEEGVYIDDVSVTCGAIPSGAGVPEEGPGVETPIALHQNRPNPFTPSTTIAFTLRRPGHVTLAVYNIQGRRIATLLDEDTYEGDHTVSWDGTDELGVDVAAGVYMYRLAYEEFEETRKMILVR
jgi:hypothetical protein